MLNEGRETMRARPLPTAATGRFRSAATITSSRPTARSCSIAPLPTACGSTFRRAPRYGSSRARRRPSRLVAIAGRARHPGRQRLATGRVGDAGASAARRGTRSAGHRGRASEHDEPSDRSPPLRRHLRPDDRRPGAAWRHGSRRRGRAGRHHLRRRVQVRRRQGAARRHGAGGGRRRRDAPSIA